MPEGKLLDPRVPRETPDPLVDQDVEVVSVRVIEQPADGWSWRPGYITPTSGTIVSRPYSDGFSCIIDLIPAKLDRLVVRAEVMEWLRKSLPYLAMHDDTYLGGWISIDTQRLYLDVSERYDDHAEAVGLGQARNQEAVFRLSDKTTHPTGGDGK